MDPKYQNQRREGGNFYPGLEIDPIRSITDTLAENLKSGKFDLAETDYQRLLRTIEARGRREKDIGYAQKQLKEISKEYQTNHEVWLTKGKKYIDSTTISTIKRVYKTATRYSQLLPNPVMITRESIRTIIIEPAETLEMRI